jgi:hypothetical protein
MAGDPADYAWRQQSRWSQAANRLKAGITRARWLALALTVAGAVLGTASAQLHQADATPARTLAVAAAVLLVLIPFARRGAGSQATRDWTRARAVAEAIKSDVYTYLAHVEPFRDGDRHQELLRRLDGCLNDVGDLVKHVAGIDPAKRSLPRVHDVESYAKIRVRSQIEGYYQPKARAINRKLTVLSRAETALAVTSAALVAAAAIIPAPGVSVWIGVLTTVAGAIAAHTGAERYEYQFVEFTRTADKLDRLLTRRGVDQRSADEFVAECERVISIQNEGWMAKLTLDEEPQAAGSTSLDVPD